MAIFHSQLKSVERRNNDIAKRLQRKAQVLEITHKEIDGTRQEIEDTHNWVVQKINSIKNPEPLGYESKAAKERQQELVFLLKEADGKKTFIDSLEKKVRSIQNELESPEQGQLETSLANLTSEQKQLTALVKAEIEKVGNAIQARKKFESDLEKAHAWLKSKVSEVRKLGGYAPLKVAKIENDLEEHRIHESGIKDFGENRLNDLQKQGNTLLKECSPEDRESLQALIDAVNNEYETLKKESNDKFSALNDLLQGRRQFEDGMNKCHHWLNEAEVAVSADLRTSSIALLEEQLAKYEKLNNEAAEIDATINSVSEQSKAIIPTLSDADKLKLNEELNSLRDKHARISAVIRDKTKTLQDHLKDSKEAAAKIAEAVKQMNMIKIEIKNLNKPIGSKAEDVQGMLVAYEKILNDLKENKAKLCDLQGGSNSELQDILGQQDDLIKAIEDQISKLRYLLLLREQFIALINEIMTFIMKYTSVVTDIEKSGTTSEEKIKRYDDVILKIQECEATLAGATDKGQQIAAEGTAADRNSITEQLQSLKQQLQTLRRAVERQRQEHEKAAAEHKKISNDLMKILEWLHTNEAVVRSRPLLMRDVESTDKHIAEHSKLADNVNKQLDKIRKLKESIKHDDGMPSSLQEMLSEANSLLSTLPRELEERGKYLHDNRQYRLDYAALNSKLNTWVKEANNRLAVGKDGVDFENIITDLEEHKIFFSSEQPMKELVAHQMQQAADKIWPSLVAPEQEELSKEQQEKNQLLKNTLNSAKSRQAQLEQDVEIWKDYCQLAEKMLAILDRSKFTEEPVSNYAGLQFNIQKIEHALNDIQVR